jgi:heterodisulfide reductase subunit B
VPIVYLSQFVGRAIGVGDGELGLKKHMVPVDAVLA